ncbi:MAG: MinD/ParA family protein [PVC group bacterium]|nr:MinD/ParA family protein [PVC group bacterium]
MSDSKKLGKSIEDISYLFLSPSGEDSSEPDDSGQQEEKSTSILETPIKSICMVGGEFSFLDAFLVINLSLALARLGMRIAVVDLEPERPCLNFFLGTDGQKEDSNNMNTVIKEGPLGVKLISLNTSALTELSNTAKNSKLISQLNKIEEDVDLILVNVMQRNLMNMHELLPEQIREFLVLTYPDKNKMIESYRTMKMISQRNPLTKIGVVVAEVDHMYEIDAVYDKMSGAVRKFLDKELYKGGFLFKIKQDLDVNATIASFYDADLTACISNIAQIVVLRLNLGENIVSKEAFFKKMIGGFNAQRKL